MLDIHLRNVKDAIVRPMAIILAKWCYPMVLTLAGLVVGLASAWAISQSKIALSIFLWVLNRILDGLDGAVARVQGSTSDFGGYIDILVDFTVYGCIPIGIAWSQQSIFVYLSLSFMVVAFFVNAAGLFMLSAIIEKRLRRQKGEVTSVAMPPALIEGTETLVIFTVFLILPQYAMWLFSGFAFLVCVTIAQRVYWAKKNL